MKSKSFDLKQISAGKHNVLDKTIEFVGLYKSVAETNKVAEKRKSDETAVKETPKPKTVTPKRERSPNKNKKRSKQEAGDVAHINIDGSLLNSSLTQSNSTGTFKVTSTPNTSAKSQGQEGRVKSIMKNKSPAEHSVDSSRSTTSSGKPKKRNKSVSFMLDDNEEVMVKRTKSDDSKVNKKPEVAPKLLVKDKRKNFKKLKKEQSEKENKATEVNTHTMEVDNGKSNLPEKKPAKVVKPKKMQVDTPTAHTDTKSRTQEIKEKKKKLKKIKKQKSEQSSVSELTHTEHNNNEVSTDSKIKKPKKKKVKSKSPPAETAAVEGEPVPKTRKKEANPDIAEDLENLSIGDNAHTLTNLLDEMTVVDKDKRKKLRQKLNKNKKPKGPQKEDSEKSEEVKEKVKWKKRKWNKDKKGEADEEGLGNTVLVENLPLSIMLNYKKLLTEHFNKHGLIRKIGLAEVYPTEESKPVFTTTISFHSDSEADLALQENFSYIEGNRIRVKRALPATQTTVVIRSYADLTDQALCSLFVGAGRIRSIRHLVKGKKTMSTAFVEFDGPETVERAIKTAGDAKIGGKKIHLAKFEIRAKKVKKQKNEGDSAADADSEDSND